MITTFENKGTRMEETLYNSIVSNARQVGSKYYADVPVELLIVDPEYQRIESRSQNKINKLAAQWDRNRLDALRTVAHPEEFKFSVVDGFGRLCASQLLIKPYKAIECEIILDAPSDPKERRKFEAKIFAKQEDCKEKLRPIQKHRANLLLEDPAAMLLQKICDKYDVTIDPNIKRGWQQPGFLGAYIDLYKIAGASDGAGCLDFIFAIIKNTGWNLESNAYARHIITAFRTAYRAHEAEREAIAAYISDEFRDTTPLLFKADSVSRYPKRGVPVACALYLEDLIVRDLNIERKTWCQDGRLIIAA